MRISPFSRRAGVCLLLGASLACAAETPASAKPGAGASETRAGVPTLTLYMKQFGELEARLLAAQANRNAAQLEVLLSPLFEYRRAEGGATPRQSWLEEQLRLPELGSKRLTHLVVFETGAHAIANFRLGDEQGKERFIVDVWAPTGEGQWQLRARFDSPTGAQKY